MNPPLNVHNAQISTVKVEVKTLTISGKQVTLAVFRQLIDELLIAEDGRLKGVAWGTVNYHPDKCSDDPPHWHIVWQLGDELRRAKVSAAYKPEEVFWSKALTYLHAASIHHWLVTGETRYFQGDIFKLFDVKQAWSRRSRVDSYRQNDFIYDEIGIKIRYRVPEEIRTALLAKSDLMSVAENWETKKQQVAKAEQELEIDTEYLSAASRRGFRRTKAPEDHSRDCTCPACLSSDPNKAANRVRREETGLEEARQQASEYYPGSARDQQAQAALSAALTALQSRYVTKPLDALWTAYRRELKAEVARRKRHVDARKNIADLYPNCSSRSRLATQGKRTRPVRLRLPTCANDARRPLARPDRLVAK